MSNINFYSKIPKKYIENNHYNPNGSKIHLYHPMRMAIVGMTNSFKTNSCFNIINAMNCFDRYILIAKNLQEPLYQFFIDTLQNIGDKIGEEVITFSNSLDDLPDLDELDTSKQTLIIIDDMISDNLKNKKLTDVFIRGRKSNVSCIFISQMYHSIPKLIRGQCSHFVLKQINNKKDRKLIVSELSQDKTPDEVFDMYQLCNKR